MLNTLLLHDGPVGPIDDVEGDEGEREDDQEGRVDRGDPLALGFKGGPIKRGCFDYRKVFII